VALGGRAVARVAARVAGGGARVAGRGAGRVAGGGAGALGRRWRRRPGLVAGGGATARNVVKSLRRGRIPVTVQSSGSGAGSMHNRARRVSRRSPAGLCSYVMQILTRLTRRAPNAWLYRCPRPRAAEYRPTRRQLARSRVNWNGGVADRSRPHLRHPRPTGSKLAWKTDQTTAPTAELLHISRYTVLMCAWRRRARHFRQKCTPGTATPGPRTGDRGCRRAISAPADGDRGPGAEVDAIAVGQRDVGMRGDRRRLIAQGGPVGRPEVAEHADAIGAALDDGMQA
jgi:hypothetical protein